jgi:hypothetical protein
VQILADLLADKAEEAGADLNVKTRDRLDLASGLLAELLLDLGETSEED